MKNAISRRVAQTFMAVVLPFALSAVLAKTGSKPAEDQIKAIIAKTYDQPGKPVETAPVVIVGNHALADWIQGEMGGRALLRLNKGAWEIMACGGDDFKKVKTLGHAGIPNDTARKLIAQLEQAEKSVSPERVKRFGLFGTPSDPRRAGHHGAHTAPHAKH